MNAKLPAEDADKEIKEDPRVPTLDEDGKPHPDDGKKSCNEQAEQNEEMGDAK